MDHGLLPVLGDLCNKSGQNEILCPVFAHVSEFRFITGQRWLFPRLLHAEKDCYLSLPFVVFQLVCTFAHFYYVMEKGLLLCDSSGLPQTALGCLKSLTSNVFVG